MKLIEKVRLTASRLKTMARRPPRKAPPQKLQARVRASVAAAADPYDDDEPQTKLTSAFVVVLILHVVAVGGIYAFNQIKASRRSLETGADTTSQPSAKSSPAAQPVEPATTRPTAPVAAASATTPATSTLTGSSHQRVYNVKAGDTLNSIAKANGTTVTELKTFNSLPNDSIRPGQILNLPAPGAKPLAETAQVKKTEPAAEAKPATRASYTVKSGDRLIFIAKKFNVTTEELVAFNKISDPAKLQIGQTLKIPAKK
jgi:LysM repeat protein